MRLPIDLQNTAIRLYKNKLSSDVISKTLKISRGSVFNILKRNRIPSRPVGVHSRKYQVNQDFFKEINSEEKAYWLGFIYADGNIYKNTIQISLAQKDIELLEKFKTNISSSHPIFHIKKTNSVRLAIYSPDLCRQLSVLGCMERKTFLIRFPNESAVPEKFSSHFMRGYFDGDGCVIEKNKRFSIISCREFIEKFLEKLNEKTGLNKTTLIKNSVSNVFSFSYSGKFNLTKIYDFLYKDATIFLNRKRDIFLNIPRAKFKTLKDEQQNKILEILKANPGISRKHICQLSLMGEERCRYIIKSLVQQRRCFYENSNSYHSPKYYAR